MDRIFLDALFKNYWIPPTFGQTTFAQQVRTQRRAFNNARKQILDAMIALGQTNLTILELATQIGNEITAQMVLHHMRRMQIDGLVRREKKVGKPTKGGQAPTLWSLVK